MNIPTSSKEIDSIWEGIKQDLMGMQFGEVGVTFIVHQGIITRVDKSIRMPAKVTIVIGQNGSD